MLLPCPACQATNRVPDERLNDKPVCGKCGAELLAAQPVSLTDANFQPFVAASELPVLVDFWAEWCGPCKMMAPHFARAATKLPQVRFAKLETDQQPRTAAAFGIRSIPTLILFHNGREAARLSGALPEAELVAWVQRALAAAG